MESGGPGGDYIGRKRDIKKGRRRQREVSGIGVADGFYRGNEALKSLDAITLTADQKSNLLKMSQMIHHRDF